MTRSVAKTTWTGAWPNLQQTERALMAYDLGQRDREALDARVARGELVEERSRARWLRDLNGVRKAFHRDTAAENTLTQCLKLDVGTIRASVQAWRATQRG